ncbi:alanine racemase [Jannaschia sp. Os4]|uniref:alanine racemase n=1 Tax=Jannaschia sp. Os4 TaxID=2807617 RepID=UPI0019397F98|nr:alanine racemase [Jannaschia sp. Os4]MBM2574694.1 alanine racemase [Jannaschia sp. Os4]
MGTGVLHIDLEAVAANWRALDAASAAGVETAAVVKANGYGLGALPVAKRLARAGARTFFVATAAEGLELRRALGEAPAICVFYGHMAEDTLTIQRGRLTPMIPSVAHLTRHLEALPGHPFGIQLDTGMNRLGLKWGDWAAVAPLALKAKPKLVMSHLSSADDPASPESARQLATFREMTDGISVPRSLAATGGTLLGKDYHFDMTRPGVGLFGGLPFAGAEPVVALEVPVISCFDVEAGEAVGYNATWRAPAPTRVATVAAGYADGLPRALSGRLEVMAGKVPCPAVGRVSMDLITVDIGHLDRDPGHVSILDPHRGVDRLAAAAGTIGYEVLTSLGRRYRRSYRGAD